MKAKTLIKAFIIGAIEVNNMMGAEALYDWLRTIGERLGEAEGRGIEGRRIGELHYESICPFATQLESAHYHDILSKDGDKYAEIPKELGLDKTACADIICIMHHACRRKRAELAGKKVFHLAAKNPLTGEVVFNEEAIKDVGKGKEEIEKLMERATCVFMYRLQ
jgi:hypothetical protein